MASRTPRLVHPGAWWAWAAGCAIAASRTTNPLLLGLLVVSAAVVVSARRQEAPWSRAFDMFLILGAVIVAVRVLAQVAFGASTGTTVLLALPGLALPSWLAGVRLGGMVTLESLLGAVYDGLRLATILICLGAANALASPTRLLKSVPAALYEVGVSIVVALTFTPQVVGDVDRLRTARRLRGRSTRGPAAIAAAALPVLENALERSVQLAASMDARGYGRRADSSAIARRLPAGLLLTGLVFACIGAYGVVSLDTASPLGVPTMAIGVVAAVVGLALAGRTRLRTRYRPDRWALPEWCIAGTGIATATCFVCAGFSGMTALHPSTDPPELPTLPLVLLLAVLVAMAPAAIAPRVPEPLRPRPARMAS